MKVYLQGLNGPTVETEITKQGHELGSGGEGEIIHDARDPDRAFKLYFKPSPERERKLLAMLSNAPQAVQRTRSGGSVVRLAWPTSLIYSTAPDPNFPTGHACLGFVMPYFDRQTAVNLQLVLSAKHRARSNLRGDGVSDYRYRLTVAINLAQVLEYVHSCGHAVVDLKPVNIFVHRETGVVSLLDCDSFRVLKGNEIFPASVATPEYLAPECFGDVANAGVQADLFALGVVLSQLLNNDLHPSTGQVHEPADAPDNLIARLRRGIVSLNPAFRITPHVNSIEGFLPDEILSMLRRALLAPPDQRPTAGDWRRSLSYLLEAGLRPCAQGVAHHVAFRKGCPWCAQTGAAQIVAPPATPYTPASSPGPKVQVTPPPVSAPRPQLQSAPVPPPPPATTPATPSPPPRALGPPATPGSTALWVLRVLACVPAGSLAALLVTGIAVGLLAEKWLANHHWLAGIALYVGGLYSAFSYVHVGLAVAPTVTRGINLLLAIPMLLYAGAWLLTLYIRATDGTQGSFAWVDYSQLIYAIGICFGTAAMLFARKSDGSPMGIDWSRR